MSFSSFEEEIEMFSKAKSSSKYLERFLSHYYSLVSFVASKYRKVGSFDDMYQEGCIGLLVAFDRFDPSKGVRFAHYSRYWIRNKIQDHLWKNYGVKVTRDKYLSGDLPKRQLEDESFSLESSLAYSSEDLSSSIEEIDRAVFVSRLLNTLSSRDQKIIKMYFGIGTRSRSYQEIGGEIGCTKQRVQQIVKASEKKFSEFAIKNGLDKSSLI
jgi:RNA polymerase sigma factor (sigma-70 family)